MKAFKPSMPYSTPFVLLTPTYTSKSGVEKKTYPTMAEALLTGSNVFYGSFKTYGGTEREINGVYVIEDTANVETWYRPDIDSDCRIARANDGAIYEILNEPEDIDLRHQFLRFKVRRIKGGA